MKADTSTQSWGNTQMSNEWIKHAQTNPHRNHFIMPFTLEKLGDVSGKSILDLGCGEGGYSRELCRRGALVTGVDCGKTAIDYCIKKSKEEQLEIMYFQMNSCDLSDFKDNSFDNCAIVYDAHGLRRF